MSITLATVDSLSTTDILSSAEFADFRRRDDPNFLFVGSHYEECPTCASDLAIMHRDGFRDFLSTLPATPDSTATPEHTTPDQVDVPSVPVAAAPARYSYHYGQITMSSGDRADYGILDAETHTVAPWVGDTYTARLNDGAILRTALNWQELEPGFRFPDGYVVPTPDPEASQFATWQLAMAHFIYQYVYDQGNVSYYNTLANKGLLPDRHLVRAWRAGLTEGGEVNAWLTALGEQALESEMCEVYDRMCEGLKLPTREELGLERERDFIVRGYVDVTVRVPVSTTVRARNEEEAEENAESPDEVVSTYDIREAISNGDYSIDNSEWEEVDEN
jgi:hypothetical protein